MYYEVLGVTPEATEAELRSAYRRAVRSAHPDLGGTDEAFRAVQNAWAVLGDPVRRQAYTARAGTATSTTSSNPTSPPPQPEPPPSETARPAPPPRSEPPEPEAPDPDEGAAGAFWFRRHRIRILQVLLAVTAATTGSLTLWVMSTIGRPVTAAAVIYLGAMAVCLAMQAAGNQAGEGTYRRLVRTTWILTGVCAGLALLAWAAHRDYLAPTVWAMVLAVFAGSVTLLGRTLPTR